MKENNFIYADLSTYDLRISKQFYSSVFGWNYQNSGEDYWIAFTSGKEATGLYETPKKFQEMNMPSFWMSYIQVNSVEKTVEKAKELGGIIELVDLEASIGRIALIRDPLGAGFTIYEGDQLNTRTNKVANTLTRNQLFISDITKIKPFYEGIFHWNIEVDKDSNYKILNSKSKMIGSITEVSNAIKGKYEYWSVFFSVNDIEKTKNKILDNGGTLVYEDEGLLLMADSFGAFFHLVPAGKNKTRTISTTWKPIVGLLLIALIFFTGWNILWSIFFFLWALADVRSGSTHMLQTIYKKDQPLLYWIVISLWISLSLLSIYTYYKA